MEKNVVAIIDIGSSSIKMKIYEISSSGIKVLEDVRQHVTLGNDSFYEGSISRKSINDCVTILKRYKRLCSDYNTKEISAFATTAVREATNVDIFLDNIYRHTDIEVILLDSEQETEFIYRSMIDFLIKKDFNLNQKIWAILEIGAGNINFMLLEERCILYSKSLPLGALKMKQLFKKIYKYSEQNFLIFLKSMINSEISNLKRDMPDLKIEHLFIIATEISQLKFIKNELEVVSKKQLKKIYSRIKEYNEEELNEKFKIPYDLTDSFIPSMKISIEFADFLKPKDILIPKISLTDGIVYHLYFMQEEADYYEKLEKQLMINATNIGRSLNFDEEHAVKVMQLSLKLFEETKQLHRLGKLERCYLVVASLLHDIGASISYRSHHKHSYYIIKSLNFFALTKEQEELIANIARYHRKSEPKTSHSEYMNLKLYDRITVLKLASILRIADSLDNSHQQIVEDIEVDIDSDNILIKIKTDENFFAELFSFEYKKRLFEDFFGVKVELKKMHL